MHYGHQPWGDIMRMTSQERMEALAAVFIVLRDEREQIEEDRARAERDRRFEQEG